MRYRVRHQTTYSYGSDVVHSHQLLHLLPRPSPYQQCLEYSIAISPSNCTRRDEADAFGNLVTRVEFVHAHRELDIATQMEVDVHSRPVIAAADTLPWERVRDSLSYSGGWPAREELEASRFRHESPYVRVKQAFTDYAEDCFPPGQPVLACAEALMQKLHRELTYAPGETNISTPLTEVLQNRRGVCQDFAHLMIACVRSKGLAARYVSGYVRLRPAPNVATAEPACDDALADFLGRAEQADSADAPNGAGADDLAPAPGDYVGAGASHAWVSVYIPPFGWLDLDPTNNVRVGTDHVTVAWGRDFGDVSPLRGVILGGGTHDLSVCVTVEPLAESPAIQ